MHALIKGLVVATLIGAGFALHHHHGWLFGAQDDKKQDAKKEFGGMAIPEPTAEHKWLADGVGTFKAVGKMMQEDGTWMQMTGVQTNAMQQGGLWQLTDYKDDKGMFVGHGITGYDPAKKKFVGVWVDSMGTALEPSEGTLSADKKTLTMTVGMTDPKSGKRITMTETVTRKDDKSALMEFMMPGPDGKPMKMMEITYTKM
jgi:hypothetical protein